MINSRIRISTYLLGVIKVDVTGLQALGRIRQVACSRQREMSGPGKDQVRHSIILDLFHIQETIVVQG